jgi:hypothetical protein
MTIGVQILETLQDMTKTTHWTYQKDFSLLEKNKIKKRMEYNKVMMMKKDPRMTTFT